MGKLKLHFKPHSVGGPKIGGSRRKESQSESGYNLSPATSKALGLMVNGIRRIGKKNRASVSSSGPTALEDRNDVDGDTATRRSVPDTTRESGQKSRQICKSPPDNNLHPLLVGHFEPDVRPFEWPKRPPIKHGSNPIQLDLFGENNER